MISLDMTYAPGDSNGYLYYWVTDEDVSDTDPVYRARASQPIPEGAWVQVVIMHTRGEGVLFYIDGQNVPTINDKPPVFPPNVYRNAVNFNAGRNMVGLKDRCAIAVDDRNTFSMSDFFVWNRCGHTYLHAHIYAYMHTCVPAYNTHTQRERSLCASIIYFLLVSYTHLCIHAYVRACMHTIQYTHTHT